LLELPDDDRDAILAEALAVIRTATEPFLLLESGTREGSTSTSTPGVASQPGFQRVVLIGAPEAEVRSEQGLKGELQDLIPADIAKADVAGIMTGGSSSSSDASVLETIGKNLSREGDSAGTSQAGALKYMHFFLPQHSLSMSASSAAASSRAPRITSSSGENNAKPHKVEFELPAGCTARLLFESPARAAYVTVFGEVLAVEDEEEAGLYTTKDPEKTGKDGLVLARFTVASVEVKTSSIGEGGQQWETRRARLGESV